MYLLPSVLLSNEYNVINLNITFDKFERCCIDCESYVAMCFGMNDLLFGI